MIPLPRLLFYLVTIKTDNSWIDNNCNYSDIQRFFLLEMCAFNNCFLENCMCIWIIKKSSKIQLWTIFYKQITKDVYNQKLKGTWRAKRNYTLYLQIYENSDVKNILCAYITLVYYSSVVISNCIAYLVFVPT